jgi:linear primary-alkylsulfatase
MAADDAVATLELTIARLIRLAGGDTSSPGVAIDGDVGAVQSLLGALDPGPA